MRFLYLCSVLWLANLSPARAEEVPHFSADCPDLTGYFVFPDEVFEPMRLKVTSAKNEAGEATLSMLVADGETEDFLVLTGRAEGGVRGACFDQAVFVYEYDGQAGAATSSRMYLNGEKNLVLDIQQRDGDPKKISVTGIRQ